MEIKHTINNNYSRDQERKKENFLTASKYFIKMLVKILKLCEIQITLRLHIYLKKIKF